MRAFHTFHRLLWRDLDELGPAKCNTAHVGKDVVDDDQAHGQEEPDHALKDVVHDEVSLHHDQVQSHVGPGELGELESVVAFLEGSNEEDEAWKQSAWSYTVLMLHLTNNVKHKTDEPMMRCKREQHAINQDNMLKVVNHTLPVQKVHG